MTKNKIYAGIGSRKTPKNISEEAKYKCPYSSNQYFCAIPIFLFSEEIEDRIKDIKISYRELYLNKEWIREQYFEDSKNFELSCINQSFLGHGYTMGLQPSDGNRQLFDALVLLDNSDFLGFKIFVWYNK